MFALVIERAEEIVMFTTTPPPPLAPRPPAHISGSKSIVSRVCPIFWLNIIFAISRTAQCAHFHCRSITSAATSAAASASASFHSPSSFRQLFIYLFSLNAAAVPTLLFLRCSFLFHENEKLNSKTHCLARNDRNRGNDDVYVLKVLTHQ